MNHERIYLQADADTVISNGGATWCQDQVNDDDVEYVRADLLAAAQAEARELRQSRRDAIDMANDNAVLAAEAMQERDELRDQIDADALAHEEARNTIEMLRAELARVRDDHTGAELSELKHDLETASISAFMSPEKLPKDDWYAAAGFCRRVIRRAIYLVEDRIDALSQPAEPCPGCKEHAEDCDCGYLAWEHTEQPDSPSSDLPLIARRDFMGATTTHCIVSLGGSRWASTFAELPEITADDTIYRIADTDEHGLPVIERTADMPKGAKCRWRWAEYPEALWVYDCEYRESNVQDWQRIEDYNAHAEPAHRRLQRE